MDEEILKLLGRADYAPANVPELLRLLRWPPNRQQQLQQVLQRLEQSGTHYPHEGQSLYSIARGRPGAGTHSHQSPG